MNHINTSVYKQAKVLVNVNCNSQSGEKIFQDGMVKSVGQFSHGIQTYQKIEVCTFILQNLPSSPDTEEDAQYEAMLLQCIMKITSSLNVSTNDKAVGLPTLFPLSLIVPLQVGKLETIFFVLFIVY